MCPRKLDHYNIASSQVSSQIDKNVVDARDTTLAGSQTTTGHIHDSTTQTRVGGNVGTIRDAVLNDGNQFIGDTQRLQTWGNNTSAFVASYNQAKGGDVSAREQLVDATTEMFKDVQGTMSTQDMVSLFSKQEASGGLQGSLKVPEWIPIIGGTGGSLGGQVSGGSDQRSEDTEAIKAELNRSYINHMFDSSQGNVDFSENVKNLYEQQRNYAIGQGGQGQDSNMKDDAKKN